MAVFVFMVIMILFFGIMSSMSTPERGERLSKDAELITKALTGEGDDSIVKENKLDEEKVSSFVMDSSRYQELKKELGVNGDFCIYFEDGQGNLVPIKVTEVDGEPQFINGLGNETAMINDVPCGEMYEKEQE